ncbi:MAG: peptidylprolyl isomerase [Cytophagales bacterium]
MKTFKKCLKETLWVFVSIAVFSCKNPQQSNSSSTKQPKQEPWVLQVDDQKVSVDDFKYVYSKNNSGNEDAFTEKSLNDYMSLYQNFRLKVREAEKLGMDTTSSFKNELDGYRKQLAQPYLKEKGVTERLIKEAYDRMKQEVNASHILLNLAEDAEPKDTLAIYNKIMELRKRVLAGEKFEELAKIYSEDPSAKVNGGNLGYFTSLQMVYPFENAAFNTKVGEVSMPVRTRFGYHILKVNDKRPSQGQVRVAHIMVRYNAEDEDDMKDAEKKALEIYEKLNKGEKWDDLCAQFSDHVQTKNTGGVLNWFGTGNFMPEFENAAFGLKNQGDISKPVKTVYGWHIIKLLEKKELEPFEALEQTIKNKVTRDSRSDLNKVYFLQRIKKENNLIENAKSKEWATSKIDSSLAKGKWSYDENQTMLSQTLFSISGKPYTIGSFFSYVKSTQRPRGDRSTGFLMEEAYKSFLEKSLMQFEEENLENKYIDFKMLVKEYRDGILLFNLMDEKVWTKAIQDTAGLRNYFNENREKYKWDERTVSTVYNCANKETFEKLKPYLKMSAYPVNDPKPSSFEFENNKSALKEADKSVLDGLFNTLSKDKNALAEISLGHVKGENKSIINARQKSIKTYLKEKNVDSTRLIFIDNGFILKKAPAIVGLRYYSRNKKALEKLFNVDNALNLQVTDGKFQKGENEFVDKSGRAKGEHLLNINERVILVITTDVEAPRNKNLEECKGAVISDYQNYLEQEWLKELKTKYKTEVNQETLKSLIKK